MPHDRPVSAEQDDKRRMAVDADLRAARARSAGSEQALKSFYRLSAEELELAHDVSHYVNGHCFVAQELQRGGVASANADHALLAVGDVAALQPSSDRLTAVLLQRRYNF